VGVDKKRVFVKINPDLNNHKEETMGAPFYRETVLPNGLRIATKRFPGTTTFSLAIVIKKGSIHDPPRLAGLAHFLEHMVHKGTKRWPSSDQLNAQFESRGIEQNALTSNNYTSFFVTEVMLKFLEHSFDFLTEITTRPLLREEDVATEQGVIIDEHFTRKDRSEAEVSELLNRMLYLHSPLGRRIEGQQATIKRIQGSDLTRMHQKYYVPNNMMVVAIGNVYHRQIVKLARHYLGHMKRHRIALISIKPSRLSGQNRRRICQPTLNASYLNIGSKFDGLSQKEIAILDILSNVLGGGTLSRLFRLIRTRLGKVYSIDASVTDFKIHQDLTINTAPLPEDLEEIIRIIITEIQRLKDGILAKELKLAKTQIIADYYRMTKYSEDFMDEFIASLVHQTTQSSFTNNIPVIRSITLNDVRQFLAQHWKPENFRIAIIAPKK
jgi:predicted Zn-dependent peptidase